MVLSQENAELFYEIFFPLLNFVNEKFKVNPEIGELYLGKRIDPSGAKKIADRLWADVGLIDEYLAEKKLSEEHKISLSAGRKEFTENLLWKDI